MNVAQIERETNQSLLCLLKRTDDNRWYVDTMDIRPIVREICQLYIANSHLPFEDFRRRILDTAYTKAYFTTPQYVSNSFYDDLKEVKHPDEIINGRKGTSLYGIRGAVLAIARDYAESTARNNRPYYIESSHLHTRPWEGPCQIFSDGKLSISIYANIGFGDYSGLDVRVQLHGMKMRGMGDIHGYIGRSMYPEFFQTRSFKPSHESWYALFSYVAALHNDYHNDYAAFLKKYIIDVMRPAVDDIKKILYSREEDSYKDFNPHAWIYRDYDSDRKADAKVFYLSNILMCLEEWRSFAGDLEQYHPGVYPQVWAEAQQLCRHMLPMVHRAIERHATGQEEEEARREKLSGMEQCLQRVEQCIGQ